MNLYVYSDESGVFDKKHERYFVFGGIIFLSKEEKDEQSRIFLNIERQIASKNNIEGEVKSSKIKSNSKRRLYRSLKKGYKFALVVKQQQIYDEIFNHKKDKQRYLDFAYKMALKKCLERMITEKVISRDCVDNIYVFCDEHNTATSGIYELKESLESELKRGTFNYNYSIRFPPTFNKIKSVSVKYCDSKANVFIRMADIISNYVYHCAYSKKVIDEEKFSILYLP